MQFGQRRPDVLGGGQVPVPARVRVERDQGAVESAEDVKQVQQGEEAEVDEAAPDRIL